MMYKKRAKKVVYKGVEYRSKYEVTVATVLNDFKVETQYEKNVVTYVQPAKVRKYTPDFKIKLTGNVEVFIETKGRFTVADRLKMLKVLASNPNLPLIMLFENSRIKIRKGSSVTYGDWCDKNNIAWSDQSEFFALKGKRELTKWVKLKLSMHEKPKTSPTSDSLAN